jgi:glyoxylase I family protein
MAGQIAEKSLRHVSLCVSDLAKARAFYCDVLGLEELPRPDLGIPGAWLSVGGDLQLHLLENLERASGADHHLSIADPHFALWINDVPSRVEELRGKSLEILENKPGGGAVPTGVRQGSGRQHWSNSSVLRRRFLAVEAPHRDSVRRNPQAASE